MLIPVNLSQPVVEIILDDEARVVDGSEDVSQGCGAGLVTPTKCKIMRR